MTRILIGFAMAVVLALTSGAQSKATEFTFQKVKSEKARMSVEMPGQPEESKTDRGEIFEVKPSLFFTYHVEYLDITDPVIIAMDKSELMKRFRDLIDMDKTIAMDKERSLGDAKVPGREFRVKTSPVADLRVRLYCTEKRMYVLYVEAVNDEDALDSKDADRFFDSFEITAK